MKSSQRTPLNPSAFYHLHRGPSACKGELSCVFFWNFKQLASQPSQLAVLPTAKTGSSKAQYSWKIFREISPYKLMDRGAKRYEYDHDHAILMRHNESS